MYHGRSKSYGDEKGGSGIFTFSPPQHSLFPIEIAPNRDQHVDAVQQRNELSTPQPKDDDLHSVDDDPVERGLEDF
jgi:hypothetical protein